MKWLWIILALVYLLSPYDLIPGLHGVGWIDDGIVLVLLYRYLTRLKKQRTHTRTASGNQQQDPSQDRRNKAYAAHPKTPYEILGVSPAASRDEIKTAYRRLAGQYHPDKVSHLGKEFQTMAHLRFKEIQTAYDILKKDE